MPGTPQRHPSRDRQQQHEFEYELPGPAIGGVNFSPGGHYSNEDIGNAKEYWRGEGADTHPHVRAEAGGVLNPAQGRLFDSGKVEAANRQRLGRERFRIADAQAGEITKSALQSSTIPTSHLQDRPGRQHTVVQTSEGISGAGGWYRGPATPDTPDVLQVDPTQSHNTNTTFIHEAGHRKHLGEMPSYADAITHPRGINPDPIKEAAADAYVDRYGGPTSPQVRPMQEDIEAGGGQKFTSYQFTGYSTDKEAATRRGWKDSDRAMYAAARAHGSETGEQALYTPRGRDVREQPGVADYGGGDPTSDATLHSLLSTSPHAAQALRQTGLKDVGAQAFRRHRDRQLLTEGQAVQGAMFHELKGMGSGKVHGYTPAIDAMPVATNDEEFEAKFEGMHKDIDALEHSTGELIVPQHMSKNQFGEAPRTQGDVANSLGVSRQHSKKAGFTTL